MTGCVGTCLSCALAASQLYVGVQVPPIHVGGRGAMGQEPRCVVCGQEMTAEEVAGGDDDEASGGLEELHGRWMSRDASSGLQGLEEHLWDAWH